MPPSAPAVEAAQTPPSLAGPAAATASAAGGGGGGGGFSSVTVSSTLSSLNDSQREAVAFALATRDVALIHGPPGESQPLRRRCRRS